MNEILAGTAVGMARWLVYTGLVWGMIRIQKMNCTTLGLLASTAAATLISYIPYVGSYLSYVVLVVCLWKFTGSDVFPDITFTVVIAGALMFCVNLWAMAALMGELRPNNTLTDQEDRFFPADIFGEERTPVEAGETAETTAAVSAAKSEASVLTVNARELNLPDGLALRGISLNSAQPLAMLTLGKQVHTVTTGETITAQLLEGLTQVRCEEINRTSIVVTVAGTNRIRLFRR